MFNYLFSLISLMAFLLATTQAGFAAPFQFPSKIKYDIVVNGAKRASSEFSAVSKKMSSGTPVYQLSFGQFQGLGFTSKDKIYTVIFKDTLSLSRTVLTRGQEKIYEMKAKKAQGLFDDQVTDIFVYKEETLTGPIETEPYTPHKVIDLLSLFLVASESVASQKKVQNFSFFVKRSTEIVQLKVLDKTTVAYQGQNVQTTEVVLNYQGREAFKLNIYRDNKGFYFPVRLSVDDEQQGLIELIATEAF